MKITEEVMNDLLPLYFAHECSSDTKKVVEEYFQEHPEFEQQSRRNYKDPFAVTDVPALAPTEEVKTLKYTRRWMKARSFALAFAICLSLCPFSYFRTDHGSAFLFVEHPAAALIYGSCAVIFWCIYFGIKRRLRTNL